MLMVDWITAKVPCTHVCSDLIGGYVLSVDANGQIEYQVNKHLQVEGSYSSNMLIRSEAVDGAGRGSMLRLHGNPTKWLQGHNLWGLSDSADACDPVLLVSLIVGRLAALGLVQPTARDWELISGGLYKLSRVDIAGMYDLGCLSSVQAFIRAADMSCTLRQRGRGIMTGGTLYFGKHSRRWSIKCYSKGDEIAAKGHQLPSDLDTQNMRDFANKSLRIELTLRQMELIKLGLDSAANWRDSVTLDLYKHRIDKLEMNENYTLPTASIDNLPARLVAVYHLWKEGHDMRAMYPRRTYYRYRNELRKHGVDIAIKQDRHDSRDNVVPLVRVLEAKPMGIPDFAYKQGLLYEYDNQKGRPKLAIVK